MTYTQRHIDLELDELIPELAAIAIEGPRGVGKTATAEQRANSAFYLDNPAHRALAEAEPAHILTSEPPVLIDEWQRVPSIWDAVRREVDSDGSPGRFLLTGSASPITPPTHSGAGRIVGLRMRPMTLQERGIAIPTVSFQELLSQGCGTISGSTSFSLKDYVREILSTGFPAIRKLKGKALRMQLDGYLRRIIDTDFGEQGVVVRRPEILERWLAAYAAATSTTASYEAIRDAATGDRGNKPSKPATMPYRQALQQLWIVDPIPAWLPTRNQLTRLAQPVKHQLADAGLAARVLGCTISSLLAGEEPVSYKMRDGKLLGHLFESLVAQNIRAFAQVAEAKVRHLRQHSGRREIDIIVERQDQRILAIEVKLNAEITSKDVKNLVWLKERLGDEVVDTVVVNSGQHAYRREDGVAVVPAALLGVI